MGNRMMKLAWLCFEHDEDFPEGYDPSNGKIYFYSESCGPPNPWRYAKAIRIVWAEIQKNENE
jgi:hypothetical protein